MTEHKPGRKLDVAVHRALNESHIVRGLDNGAIEQLYWRPENFGRGETVPHYSTSLQAWDWTREGWGWQTTQYSNGDLLVELRLVDGYYVRRHKQFLHYVDDFRAQAYARCRCVMRWAEAQDHSIGEAKIEMRGNPTTSDDFVGIANEFGKPAGTVTLE